MTEKLISYFETSLLVKVKPLHFTNFAASDELGRSIFNKTFEARTTLFAGNREVPVTQRTKWIPLDLASDLRHVLSNDGTLCFSSAAAATIGAFSPPIYEIYKVGVEPYWNEGLNLLEPFGLDAVVIPHFDNAEGGNYDTSCCYLGRRRLTLMESELPEHVGTLGVDEHTALILDFKEDSLRVLGRSNGYWRCGAPPVF